MMLMTARLLLLLSLQSDCVVLAPSWCQGLWYQHQILQSVIDANAVLVDHSKALFDVAAVAFPKEILDVDARGAATLVLVSVGKNDGTTSVLVDLRAGLESIIVYQTYVAFV